MYDPIIGTSYLDSDNAAPKINVPIAILLIQILDIPFLHNANLSIYHPLFGCQAGFLLQCMQLKCVAYNQDELLFRKLPFWVWL